MKRNKQEKMEGGRKVKMNVPLFGDIRRSEWNNYVNRIYENIII